MSWSNDPLIIFNFKILCERAREINSIVDKPCTWLIQVQPHLVAQLIPKCRVTIVGCDPETKKKKNFYASSNSTSIFLLFLFSVFFWPHLVLLRTYSVLCALCSVLRDGSQLLKHLIQVNPKNLNSQSRKEVQYWSHKIKKSGSFQGEMAAHLER